jgi:RNA polymerase sigma-70 factor (ECF subfamily)
MNCPVNTVKTRMFHARKKLRALLPALAGTAPQAEP